MSPRPLLLFVLTFSIHTLTLTSFAHAQDEEGDGVSLELKLGLESDTNAERQEGAERASDSLTRYFLKAEAGHAVAQGQNLSLKFRSGGKLYQRFKDEDTLLNQGDVSYIVFPLVALDQRWLFVYTTASLKDRTEKGRRRDYLRGSVSAGLGLRFGPVTLRGAGGASMFIFKPDPLLSNQGPSLDLGASMDLGEDWEIHAGFSARRRDYRTSRRVSIGQTTMTRPDERELREDTLQLVSAGVSWRGPVIAGLDATWLTNLSNSYAQSIERFGLSLTLTAPLPWSFFINGRLGLQRTSYADEILFEDTFKIEEDNRNTLILELERPLADWISVVARYALYAQEFGVEQADYNRQLFFLGLGVEY